MQQLPPTNGSQTTQAVTPPSTPPISQTANSTTGNKKTSTPSPPGTDLAISAAFSICGILLSFFPTYADISLGWAILLFQILGYMCYGIGLLGALVGLSNFSKSQFFGYTATASLFVLIAFGFHLWANTLSKSNAPVSFILRLSTLLFAIFAAFAVTMGIPFLFVNAQQKLPNTTTSQKRSTTSSSTTTTSKPMLEHIANIMIVALPCITALIQFIPTLFPIIHAWFKR